MNDKRYLFRGFHPDENGETTIVINGEKIKGEWIYWDIYGKCKGSTYENNKAQFREYHSYRVSYWWKSFVFPCDVIPETVSQWVTTDKNGKDVFYDDLVKDCYGRILKVIYKSFKPMLELISYNKSKEWTNNFKYADLLEWFDEYAVDKAELIGNEWECEV